MRLGGWYSAERAEDLEALCERLDRHGLSAIPAPNRIAEMPDDECVGFGEVARDLGLVIGETGMWENLMTSDPGRRAERIERVRTLLRKAELMGCRCVVSLVGSGHPSDAMLAPDGAMLTAEGRSAFREVALRIVDGLDLERTCYAIEPWRTSFFYRPEDIRTFLDEVGHPGVRLHLDLVNMVGRRDLLRHRRSRRAHVRAALGPDRGRPPEGPALGPRPHADQVGRGARRGRGDGPRRLPGRALGARPDLPCFCEHLSSEAEFAENFARLHRAADDAARFLPRSPTDPRKE